MNILAIGERFNGPAWEPENKYNFDLRVQCGLYNYGSRHEFLERVGVHWTHGINLLWPDPTPGNWDVDEARDIAERLRPKVEKYDRVLLFGHRVCEAFNVPFKVGLIFDMYVPLPHPVGNTKLWNKDYVRRVLQ